MTDERIVQRVWYGCTIATSITIAVSIAAVVGYVAREFMIAASLI
jgi:hypothetical protein